MNQSMKLLMRDGEVVTEMVRVPFEGQICAVDTITFTCHENTVVKLAGGTLVDDDDIARLMSRVCQEIFGFGITRKRDKGLHFYAASWELGDKWGFFSIGGSRQRQTFSIELKGQGCLAAKAGWEKRLHEFLTEKAVQPRLTRIDLAHDDFEGKWNLDHSVDEYHAGHYDRYYNRPDIHTVGSWINGDPNGNGRTLYIGTRYGSQLLRRYEKGKQLGGWKSPWVRTEVEFANRDKVIPFDILLNPSPYFMAAYPCFKLRFPEGQGEAKLESVKEEVKQQSLQGQIDHFGRWCKHSYGKKAAVVRELLGDAALLDLICAAEAEPTVFKVADVSFSPTPIHEEPWVLPFEDLLNAVPQFGVARVEHDDFFSPVFGAQDQRDLAGSTN